MDKLIQTKLLEIEQKHQVKILYAVESGSRAWGFPSKDSDYDVRFIYVHQPDWYLSIDQQGVGTKRNVIELSNDEEKLDISGWEITKALRLFRKSNPSLLEWMRSPMVYGDEYAFNEELKKLEPMVFRPNVCIYHYMNMAANIYMEDLQGPTVKVKRYFYTLRAVLACEWIAKYRETPPIELSTLMNEFITEGEVKDEIERLLKRKMDGAAQAMEPCNKVVNAYLEAELERIEAYSKKRSVLDGDPTPALNALFRSTLKGAYPDQ